MTAYHVPRGGLPPQTALTTDRARFTEAYAVIPARTQSDITASYLPGWDGMRMWVLARPLSGFAETFSWYVVEVSPGGGTEDGEPTEGTEGVLFVVDGTLQLEADGDRFELEAGSYAYLPPLADWALKNSGEATATFHWIRKRYVQVEGLFEPDVLVTHERDVAPTEMPGTDGAWSTRRFVEIDDLRHDMHVNIVNFQPGGAIPFPETHVMEHGLYVLEGKSVYLLNTDWVEVEAGDFMWLRAFCPQACYAGGPGPFRYLLYKDVNRHARLTRDRGCRLP
ncbi:MAG: bifunctional allantoicase/(S)-ureidoglycine aminohydrolase [Nocardioides sp.]